MRVGSKLWVISSKGPCADATWTCQGGAATVLARAGERPGRVWSVSDGCGLKLMSRVRIKAEVRVQVRVR